MSAETIRILLVEDSPTIAASTRKMLAEETPGRFAMAVESADTMAGTLARLEEGGIDVVLLDLILPDSQGVDTFLVVKERAPKTAIVVYSSLDDVGLAVGTVERGAEDYLVKGEVDGRLLRRALIYAVERKKIKEELREKIEELELMYTATIDRELVIEELRKKVAELEKSGGPRKAEREKEPKVSKRPGTPEELEERLSDLERFYAAAVDREIEMKKLRQRVAELKKRLDEKGRGYPG